MPQLEYHIINESEIAGVIEQFMPLTFDLKIFTFKGNLGAGKTTFIKHLAKFLGSDDETSSPTYAIVNEYCISSQSKIFHFDLYRLKSLEEALNIGIEDYLDSGNYCLIEWADVIAPLLPEKIIEVEIEKLLDNRRKISIFIP